MERFFQPVACDDQMREMRRLLGSGDAEIGPVHTNYPPGDQVKPRLVIICESPSDAEVAAGFPLVGHTGQRVFQHLLDSKMLTDTTESCKAYSFADCYSLLAKRGIYLTNLVRYQADYGTGSQPKNSRVRGIWEITRHELLGELELIRETFQPVPVLLAPGRAFAPQVKEIVTFLEHLGMPWYITNHPSRSPQGYSCHYNPCNWNLETATTCGLMKIIASWLSKR